MTVPEICIVDTNVAVTANGSNGIASGACVVANAKALQSVMKRGKVVVDDGGLIVQEYRTNLAASGQPGPGDAFLKWLLTNEWSGRRVHRVKITAKADDPEDFVELPAPAEGVSYDRSDRKFLAVASAHPDKPAILQALDSKWWGWQAALAEAGVKLIVLCPEEIEELHRQKMGR